MNGRILRQLVAACVLACAGMARAAAGGEAYDVVVAGGTSYGVAAAVEAAKGGARVCLVAPRAALGEDLAGTLRLKPSDGAALPADLRARLYAANPAARNSFGGATPLQIKKALDAALIEAGVTFRCWTQPCEVAADGDGAVTGLWVAGRDGRRRSSTRRRSRGSRAARACCRRFRAACTRSCATSSRGRGRRRRA